MIQRRPGIDREAIAAAIYARLTALAGVVTTSRRLVSWNKLATEQQPAVFLAQGAQTPRRQRGCPSVWTLEYEIACYAHAQTCDAADPTTRLNAILDQLEQVAFAADNGDGVCTLGGLVDSCTLGEIETDQGALGEQAVAVARLTVIAA